MALSSDELIKQEISEVVGQSGSTKLRIFPQSSRSDQVPFSQGGLTFGIDGVLYGSCDAAWYVTEQWIDPYDGQPSDARPVLALEGTDALNRNSGGNAQYQRFHHALGAVRAGLVGVYYLRPGAHQLQPDLYGMAARSTEIDPGTYIVTSNLGLVREILESLGTGREETLISEIVQEMQQKFSAAFIDRYGGDWEVFASHRSSVLLPDFVVKYAGRSRRNFQDSSQRAGHIAVGEMYLSKYLLHPKPIVYLFPRMTDKDVLLLDDSKSTDKEWFLLRSEPGVSIATIDSLVGVNSRTRDDFMELRDVPLKGSAMTKFSKLTKEMHDKLESGRIQVRSDFVFPQSS